MKQKTAFITGASHGIGRAIAEEFARNGYSLAINCNTSKNQLKRLSQELSAQYHICCLPLVGDVGDECFVADAFAKIKGELGAVTVLINNAGISHIGLLSDMSIVEWNHVIHTNLTSAFCCSKHAIKDMVHEKNGSILNISSVWGTCGASCEVAYSASKGGLNAFTKALAKELAPSGISVNALSCGVIDTRMNQCFSPAERLALEEEIPAGRFGSPKEVAELALSIVSSTSYLTGQIITLDGGWQ
ncbi:MAG: SDR family oxidoreductase [Lachnospiraceae bacterium]